jgi:transcription initiation factor TFIIB
VIAQLRALGDLTFVTRTSTRTTAKTYSPLFVRCYAKQHKLRVTSKGIKKRASQRFEGTVKPVDRKPLALMAQVLSPGAVPDPIQMPEKEEWRENLNVRLICKDCRDDPPDLYEDHASGDLICANCGLVLQQRVIDQSSEWRTFSNDDQGNDDPSRVGDGPNSLLNGAQLNTNIAFGDGGLRSKELHRAQNKSSLDKGNKGLLQAYKQIGALCDGWQLPTSVSDTAKHLYKDADESRVFKGKSQEALIAGCVFLACRRNNVPRSFREVMELTKVSKKEIGRTFKLLENFLMHREKEKEGQSSIVAGGKLHCSFTLAEIQELLLNADELGMVVTNEAYTGSGTAEPSELCARYCSMLGMSQKATNLARALADKTSNTGALAGRSPLSAAAACIYMAGHLVDEPKNAKEIQGVAGVSDGTIRHAYKLMYADRDKIITEDMIKRGANPANLPKPS